MFSNRTECPMEFKKVSRTLCGPVKFGRTRHIVQLTAEQLNSLKNCDLLILNKQSTC